jgi:hypothetical protein
VTRWFREERERDEGERPARDATNIYSIFRKMIAAERILFLSLFHLTLEEKGADDENETTTKNNRRKSARRTLVNSTTGLASAASAIFLLCVYYYVRVCVK